MLGARHRERGFSLIEVFAAATIFTVGALGLLALMVHSAEANRTSNDIIVASSLARSKMEALMQQDFDGLSDGFDAKNLDAYGKAVDAANYRDQDGHYARSWHVVETPNGTTSFKQITVNVEWFDRQAGSNQGQGRWRRVNLAGAVVDK